MSLSELIAGVEAHQQTLTVFNADPEVAAELRAAFADRNVVVESERTPSGRPGAFVTLSEDGEVQTATGLSDLRALLDGDSTTGLDTRPYRPILDHLDETLFTSWDTDRMVATSREVEDRAWRTGAGELHAGFQTVGTLRGELDRYRELAGADLEVHVYAVPDESPPSVEGVTLHLDRASEIEDSWFVVFDGGGDDRQKCALLAEERAPRSFYGFWTYDPDTVDWILDHLRSRYDPLEQ